MAKYKCSLCGYIYDDEKEQVKFSDLSEDWVCPLCGAPKSLFEEVQEETKEEIKEEVVTPKFNNAVAVSKDNVSIERIEDLCIDCGICKNICIEKEGLTFDANSQLCINCGQCIQGCPVGALIPKSSIEEVYDNLDSKICIAYTAPATRVAIGELFGKEVGCFEQSKLVGLLRMLGFKYVLDVTFGADLTILEEASELAYRITHNGVLPMFTSCCPSWVKYTEIFYPELIKNLSTCKSPIGMQGKIVKTYFADKMNLDANNIYTVAITPCTAKKYEISKSNIDGTDAVLTLLEIEKIIKEKDIKYEDIIDSDFDSILGEGSSSGIIFGNTGGVATAALRTVYYLLTNKNIYDIPVTKVNDYLSEVSLNINDKTINVAIINKLSEAKPILASIKNGNSKYHFVEVMNCQGGCIGGGGQPKVSNNDFELKKKRINTLDKRANERNVHFSHENKDIINVYKDYLTRPLSELSEQLLHTTYEDKSGIK